MSDKNIRIVFNIPSSLRTQLKQLADKEMRTLPKQVTFILEKYAQDHHISKPVPADLNIDELDFSE